MSESVARSAKSFLVVGASGTIGSAVARLLARDGATLGLHFCRNHEAAQALKSNLEKAGSPCACFQSALDSPEACTDLVERFIMAFGAPSGVALCAGKVPWKEWRELALADWQQSYFEHCVAPFLVARAVIPAMLQARAGRIVYLSSIAAKYGGNEKTVHYAAAKGALETAMYGLSRELARAGLRVNGVRSGFVDSPQQRAGRTPEQIAARVAKISVGRPGTAEEIASAFAYLFSDGASFVNGEIITVAGGD